MTNDKSAIEEGQELLELVPYSAASVGKESSRMNYVNIPTRLLETFIAELKEANGRDDYTIGLMSNHRHELEQQLTTITSERDELKVVVDGIREAAALANQSELVTLPKAIAKE